MEVPAAKEAPMYRILIALLLLVCTTGCVEIPLAILAIDALSQDASQDDYGYDDYCN